MKTGRYIQGPSSNSFLQMSHKYTPTNRHSSAPKNPENLNQSMKLPILPTNKSMVSTHTDRNTKNKLYLLSEKVEELRSEVHNTRMDSNVSSLFTSIGNYEPHTILERRTCR